VLQVLVEAREPLSRKDIVREIGNNVKLTNRDVEKTSSGLIRWESMVRWAMSDLYIHGKTHRMGCLEQVYDNG